MFEVKLLIFIITQTMRMSIRIKFFFYIHSQPDTSDKMRADIILGQAKACPSIHFCRWGEMIS